MKQLKPNNQIIIKYFLSIFACFFIINTIRAQEIILPGRFSVQVVDAEGLQKLAQIEADSVIALAPKVWSWQVNGFWYISNSTDTLIADAYRNLPYHSFLIKLGNHFQVIKNRELHKPIFLTKPVFNIDSTLFRDGSTNEGKYQHILLNYTSQKEYKAISENIYKLGYYTAQLSNNTYDLLGENLEIINSFEGYDSIKVFPLNLIAVMKLGKWSLKNQSGKTVGKLKGLKAIESIAENVHWVRFENELTAFVDTFLNIYAKANTKPILKDKFAFSNNASDSIVVINSEGCLIDTALRNEAYTYEGHIVLDNGSEYQVYDDAGKIFYTGTYFQEIQPSTELLFKVKKKGKWGFSNREGIIRIPCRYIDAGQVFNGVVPVLLREKWAFVDRADNFKIQPILDTLENFCDGTSIASKNKKWGVLNTKAEWIIESKFASIERLPNGWFLVKDKDKYGLFNAKGEKKLVPIYEQIVVHKDGKISFKLNNKKGLYDENINLLIPAVNQNLVYDDVNRMIFIYN